MREILFRGKREDNGKWIYGDYQHFHIENDIYVYLGRWGKEMRSVKPKTVGQFTGLTDKYGKQIFEGDIVRIDKEVKEIFGISDGEVRYGWGGFYVDEFNSLNSLNTIASYDGILRGVVIGNIHDNQELLEEA